MPALKYWIWLAGQETLSAERRTGLLERFGDPETVYRAGAEDYRQAGLNRLQTDALMEKSLDRAERVLGRCEELRADILTLQDARYPERLRQIEAPPCVLYVRGRLPNMDERVAVGIVGSRNATPYGIDMANRLGRDLARGGAVVVSGIAQGIDGAALKGALQAGGTPVSVLGCGVDVIYPPEHRYLYADVAAAGALVSEYPPGTEPKGRHFPIRNRIISGLSLGVAAVEAGLRSGTLITARLALDQNRDVFAFPGPAGAPMSAGTNRLIQKGEAKLITSAQDVLEEYAGTYGHLLRSPAAESSARPLSQPRRTAPPSPPAPEQETRPVLTPAECEARFTADGRDILLALADGPLLCDELAEQTGIPVQRVLAALTLLQVQGAAAEGAGKRFSAAVSVREA